MLKAYHFSVWFRNLQTVTVLNVVLFLGRWC